MGGSEFVHAALGVGTEERAREIFEDLFGLSVIKEFEAGVELMEPLFGVKESVNVIVYDAGGAALEVFIDRAGNPPRDRFTHVCLQAADRPELVRRAEELGLGIRKHTKPDGGEIIFIVDTDGNIYEVK